MILLTGGGVCGCYGGGMRGCSQGGMRGCSQGVGVRGCSQGGHGCSGGRVIFAGGACMVFPGGHAWFLPGGVHRIRRDTVNERAVRILLECILVTSGFQP